MPYINTDCEIDLDPEDFYDYCSIREKKELAKILAEDGYVVLCSSIENKSPSSDFDWKKMLEKISLSKHRLSVEEEMMIKKIHDKL